MHTLFQARCAASGRSQRDWRPGRSSGAAWVSAFADQHVLPARIAQSRPHTGGRPPVGSLYDTVRYLDEDAPSGTAGALYKLLTDPRYAGWLDDSQPLLVVQGDAVTDVDFPR